MRVEYESLDDALRRIAARNNRVDVRRVTKVILDAEEHQEVLGGTRLVSGLPGNQRAVMDRYAEEISYVGDAYGLHIYRGGNDV